MRRAKNVWDQERGVWQPRISEEMVLKEIVTRLWLAKVKVYRINCPVGGKVRPNEPGLSDLMGVTPGGKAVFLEIKAPRGVHRVAQELFIKEVQDSGAIAGFCHSWEDAVTLFMQHGIKLEGA